MTSPRHTRLHKRIDGLAGIASAHGLVQRIEETRSRRFKNGDQLLSRAHSAAQSRAAIAKAKAACRREKARCARRARRSVPRPPRSPRRPQSACPAPQAHTRQGAPARSQLSTSDAGNGAPCRLSIASSSASRCAPRRGVSSPCQCVRNRASVCCSTGSTSRRSLASDLRRIWRRISASHHSRWSPPGRNPPSRTRPRGQAAAAPPRPLPRPAQSARRPRAAVKGPWVRA